MKILASTFCGIFVLALAILIYLRFSYGFLTVKIDRLVQQSTTIYLQHDSEKIEPLFSFWQRYVFLSRHDGIITLRCDSHVYPLEYTSRGDNGTMHVIIRSCEDIVTTLSIK